METVQEFWRPIINDFRPVGPVRPEDVERFFVDRKENNPTRSLVQLLTLSFRNSLGEPTSYKALLTGHVGSGKSSELMRLGQELANDFFVVWFDAEFTLDTEKANQFDVLLGMGLAVHATAKAADLDPDDRLANDLVKSLSRFVRRYEERKGFSLRLDQLLKQVFATALVVGAGALGGPPAALAAGAAVIGANQVLKPTRIELNVRDDLVRTLELPRNRQEVVGALNKIIEEVQDKAEKPLLIITDGLDKAPAAKAQLLFADSGLLAEPTCALVYTAPIEFHHRLGAGRMERDPNEDGLKVMRRVVAKRLEARGKSVDEIITREALDLLARTSGGVMRELVRYFRDAARFAQLLGKMQLDETIAQDVINQQRQGIAPRLNADHREALRHVLKQGELSGGQHEAAEDQLLRGLYLLSYEDDSGNSWFDAHPNVLPLL